MKYFFGIFFFLLTCVATAQSGFEEQPVMWNVGFEQFSDHTQYVELPRMNIPSLLENDEKVIIDKSSPFRFAISHQVDKNPGNSGRWINLRNGDRIWILGIDTEDALNLSLHFDEFTLPARSKIRVFSEDRQGQVLTIDHNSNNHKKVVSTLPINASKVIIEYFEPFEDRGKGYFNIASVAQGYRDLRSTSERDSNDGAQCQQNANCYGSENATASTVLIGVNNGTMWCTGVMVNNTSRNGRPYVLTSSNNLIGDPANWIFVFNYESETCAYPRTKPMNQYVSGADLIADDNSGICLLELFNYPEREWNVFYSGWDYSESIPLSSVTMHHSYGQTKSVSIDYDSPELVQHEGYDVWKVNGFEIGSVSKGSSGAPLYDENGNLIGILIGGSGDCYNEKSDYFARISSSWKQFGEYLDPLHDNKKYINGLLGESEEVDEEGFEGGISIYPNPSSGQITFQNNNEYPVYEIEVYSAMGRKITYVSNPDNTVNFDYLNSGTYFLVFKTADQRSMKTLIIR